MAVGANPPAAEFPHSDDDGRAGVLRTRPSLPTATVALQARSLALRPH
jgi:hypothetical protein